LKLITVQVSAPQELQPQSFPTPREIRVGRPQTNSSTRLQKLRGSDGVLAAALLLPNLALLLWFTYRPLAQSIRLSFVRWDMVSPRKLWVGLDNYRDFWSDPVARKSIVNTLIFGGSTVALTTVLGLMFALTLNRRRFGSQFAGSALFAPFVIPGAAVAVAWYFIFNPSFGFLAAILRFFGISSPNWYNNPNWAMVMVIIAYTWKHVGYTTVLYLAGLQAIAPDQFEAAELDGARWWGRMKAVVLPGLKPTTAFVIVTSVLSAMQSFDIIFVMTKGGPLDGTRTLTFQIYDEAFGLFRVGMASAIATVLFLILLVMTALQIRLLDRKES
jgi:sn-glycerol 3-phosphate transport system permease protein